MPPPTSSGVGLMMYNLGRTTCQEYAEQYPFIEYLGGDSQN